MENGIELQFFTRRGRACRSVFLHVASGDIFSISVPRGRSRDWLFHCMNAFPSFTRPLTLSEPNGMLASTKWPNFDAKQTLLSHGNDSLFPLLCCIGTHTVPYSSFGPSGIVLYYFAFSLPWMVSNWPEHDDTERVFSQLQNFITFSHSAVSLDRKEKRQKPDSSQWNGIWVRCNNTGLVFTLCHSITKVPQVTMTSWGGWLSRLSGRLWTTFFKLIARLFFSLLLKTDPSLQN